MPVMRSRNMLELNMREGSNQILNNSLIEHEGNPFKANSQFRFLMMSLEYTRSLQISVCRVKMSLMSEPHTQPRYGTREFELESEGKLVPS